jgi:hypothetical protein
MVRIGKLADLRDSWMCKHDPNVVSNLPGSYEFPTLLVHFKAGVPGISIINLFHFCDRIKEADDEGGAEGFSGFDGFAPKFFDQANISALMAPCLVDHRRVEGHSREPGTFATSFRVAEVISANKALRHAARVAAIIEFLVGCKVFEELT